MRVCLCRRACVFKSFPYNFVYFVDHGLDASRVVAFLPQREDVACGSCQLHCHHEANSGSNGRTRACSPVVRQPCEN